MDLVIVIIGLLYSVILHEIMHGVVARKLGDPTAKYAGRLTLNPVPHIDPFLTLLLPGIMILMGSPFVFGAAKPVPVNPLNLREGRKDMALVALAGPATNIALAVVFALIFHAFPAESIFRLITINLGLAFLNLIPLPPIDGSKVIAAFMPSHMAYKYESLSSVGIFILFFLLMFPIPGFNIQRIISMLVQSSLMLLGIGS